jgi:hypothetical protein
MFDEFWAPWEVLRQFFYCNGYDLYHHNPDAPGNTHPSAAGNSPINFNGLYGDRVGHTNSFFVMVRAILSPNLGTKLMSLAVIYCLRRLRQVKN